VICISPQFAITLHKLKQVILKNNFMRYKIYLYVMNEYELYLLSPLLPA
jgi:hypothetical protein